MKFICLDNDYCENILTIGKIYNATRNKQGYISVEKCDDGKPGTFHAKKLRSIKEKEDE